MQRHDVDMMLPQGHVPAGKGLGVQEIKQEVTNVSLVKKSEKFI